MPVHSNDTTYRNEPERMPIRPITVRSAIRFTGKAHTSNACAIISKTGATGLEIDFLLNSCSEFLTTYVVQTEGELSRTRCKYIPVRSAATSMWPHGHVKHHGTLQLDRNSEHLFLDYKQLADGSLPAYDFSYFFSSLCSATDAALAFLCWVSNTISATSVYQGSRC